MGLKGWRLHPEAPEAHAEHLGSQQGEGCTCEQDRAQGPSWGPDFPSEQDGDKPFPSGPSAA